MSTGDWAISNDDLMADKEFAENATDFQPYEHDSFYYQVHLVADRIFNIHRNRAVRGRFVSGFDSNSDGDLQGATVSVVCPEEFSMYLMRHLDLKNLTTDREAIGWDQAAAIRAALMIAYYEVRELAEEKGLI